MSIKNDKKSTPWGYEKKIIGKKGKKRYVYVQGDFIKKNKSNLLGYFGKFTDFPTVMQCLVDHENRPYMFVCDIEDAFGSIPVEFFLKDRYSAIFSDKNKLFFFHKEGGLIQGSPESPILFEHYCNETIDKEINKFVKKYNLVYTRYRDDLIFSSKRRSIGKKLRKEIRSILKVFDFKTNLKKDKIINLNSKSAILLGVDVNRYFWNIPEKKYNEAKNAFKQGNIQYYDGVKNWQKYIIQYNFFDMGMINMMNINQNKKEVEYL